MQDTDGPRTIGCIVIGGILAVLLCIALIVYALLAGPFWPKEDAAP